MTNEILAAKIDSALERLERAVDVVGQAGDRVTEEAGKLRTEREQLIPQLAKNFAKYQAELLEVANFRMTEIDELRREAARWRQVATDQFQEIEDLKAQVGA